MRAIPENAVRPAGRLRMGTMLSDMRRKIGLATANIEALAQTRDKTPDEPVSFGRSCSTPMSSPRR
jgi:hypothetical protein